MFRKKLKIFTFLRHWTLELKCFVAKSQQSGTAKLNGMKIFRSLYMVGSYFDRFFQLRTVYSQTLKYLREKYVLWIPIFRHEIQFHTIWHKKVSKSKTKKSGSVLIWRVYFRVLFNPEVSEIDIELEYVKLALVHWWG